MVGSDALLLENIYLSYLEFFWMGDWCWERFKAGGEGDDRGWDAWTASLTWWTWVWASSESWWWTGKPGMLQSTGLQSQTWLSDWTELNLDGKFDSLPPFIYSVHHLYQYGLTSIYFMPWVLIQILLYFSLKLLQPGSLGGFSMAPMLFPLACLINFLLLFWD